MSKFKQYGLIVFTIVFSFAGLYGIYLLINKPVVYPEINVVRKDDHVKWSQDNKIILVEYSDFQCPACKTIHEYLRKEFEMTNNLNVSNKITFVFRHFPLYQTHANSLLAAYAVEAAGQQNKFFFMVDLLYDKQSEWSNSSDAKSKMIEYAQKIKLDMKKFSQDIDSQTTKNRVKKDLTEAEKINIDSTPSFFLNGQKMSFNSLEEFKQMLQEAAK
jgi:protein-disulfide isomerase